MPSHLKGIIVYHRMLNYAVSAADVMKHQMTWKEGFYHFLFQDIVLAFIGGGGGAEKTIKWYLRFPQPGDRDSMFLQNFDICLQVHLALQPSRPTLLWKNLVIVPTEIQTGHPEHSARVLLLEPTCCLQSLICSDKKWETEQAINNSGILSIL
jgi:hypothetical protein